MRKRFMRWLRHRSPWGLAGLGVLAIVLLALIGSGVYAAIYGANNTTSSVDLQKGLVGWWKMDGNAKDSTPYSDNGTVNGATLTTDREGKANSAYKVASTGGYISLGNPVQLNTASSLTYSIWLMRTSTSTLHYPEVMGSADTHVGYGIRSQNFGDSISFEWGNSPYSGGSFNQTTSMSLPLNQWHMFTFTYTGSTVLEYRDGVYVDGNSGVTLNPTLQPISFSQPATAGFAGSIDDARIYNRALSAGEVKALYTQYSPGLALASGEKGLVGWWKLDGNAKDSTPYANNGTVNAATLTTDRKGAANSAYSFSGSNYITTTKTSPYNTSYVSVSAWVYASADSAFQTVASRYLATSNNGDWLLGESNLGKFRFSIYQGGSLRDASTTTGFSINAWHLLTGTYDGSTVKLYVDGANVASVSYAGTLSTNTDSLAIGSRSDNSWPWHGKIDDVRVYNRALSATEIANQYSSYNSQINLQSSPASGGGTVNLNSGLVGYWPFNGNAKDATPYSASGTVNGATLTTDRRSTTSHAYSFDGSSSSISIGNKSELSFERTSKFSVSAWVKTTSPTQAIVSKSLGDATGRGYEVGTYLGYPYMLMSTNSATNSSIFVYGSTHVNDGNWHNVVYTYNGSTLASGVTMTVDGSAQTITTSLNALSGTMITTGPVMIGTRNNVAAYWNGALDDIRVYNRVLSTAEATALSQNYY